MQLQSGSPARHTQIGQWVGAHLRHSDIPSLGGRPSRLEDLEEGAPAGAESRYQFFAAMSMAVFDGWEV
jgi:uncharacterized protein YbjT (DUF2867 family)